MENIGLSSLIVRDIKAVGNTLVHLQEKAVGSIKHLYDNMKHQLSYNLTKAQEKFVQMKIGIVKGLVNSMQDFIKDQQKKLDSYLEKLDNLSKEIQKDEEKLGKDSLNLCSPHGRQYHRATRTLPLFVRQNPSGRTIHRESRRTGRIRVHSRRVADR